MALSRNRRSVSFHKLHKYYRCGVCKSYSLFPKLRYDEIVDLYSIKYIENVNPESNMHEQITVSRFLKLQETLEQIDNRKSKRFLDYGCGATAEVIILASKLGYVAFGVEVKAGTRQEAHLRSTWQIFSPEEALDSGAQFDIIFLGDVLEHLCNPLTVLDQVQALLSPNGLRESIVKALKSNRLTIQKLVVTEPLWPAPKFGTRSSLASITALIFSFAKILDMAVSKVFSKYGTRFFLTATKQ